MNRLTFLPIVLMIILSSCTRSFDELSGQEGEGIFRVALSVDDRLEIVPSKAEALDESLVPAVDDLWVEIYRFGKRQGKPNDKDDWRRLYFGAYSEAKEKEFRVNAGQYKLLAFHGDETACGFDKPYFEAVEEFVVNGIDEEHPDGITTVEAIAKVANVRISVEFDETVSGSYYDYFLRLTNLDRLDENGNPDKCKQILRYKRGETRDAYMMPAEELQIQFMAQYEYGDESSWKYVTLGNVKAESNDHITVKVKIKDPRTGSLDVSIVTDDNIEEKVENVEILEEWAPQGDPVIVAAGFPENDHPVVEGDDLGNTATVSVVARAGLANFFVKVDSEYLIPENGFDIPLGEELDIANPTEETIEKLNKLAEAGFEWLGDTDGDGKSDMLGSRRLNYLTMTDLFAKINEGNPSLTVARNLATFTIRVVDDVANESTLVLTSTAYPITQTLSIPDGNVWATKIVSPMLGAERGARNLFMLQVSSDGENWEDLKTFEKADNAEVDFGTLQVNPDTEYWFRTRYNENDNLISNVVKVRTEKALQVENSGFEDFQTVYLDVNVQAGKDYKREWYLPYVDLSSAWWAVNSRKTMPNSHSVSNINFKCFPCAAYSIDAYSGSKSAMVYTVNVNWWNTDGTSFGDKIPGEIWIGTTDDSGDHVTDGHAFESRPLSLKFMYKYAPLNTEKFVVSVVLKDAEGNEIAKAEKLDGSVALDWTECEMPILYSDLTKKAATIFISFKSCSSGEISMNKKIEIAGKEENAHIGSVLRIDDIELIY